MAVVDLLLQGGCELSLFEDGFEDRIFAAGEFACFSEGIFDGAELSFIEAAGGFFAVACDEGDGVAVIQQPSGA